MSGVRFRRRPFFFAIRGLGPRYAREMFYWLYAHGLSLTRSCALACSTLLGGPEFESCPTAFIKTS